MAAVQPLLPPLSLLIERDVLKGREHLNFRPAGIPVHSSPGISCSEACDGASDNNSAASLVSDDASGTHDFHLLTSMHSAIGQILPTV